jgi:hypothetical protein
MFGLDQLTYITRNDTAKKEAQRLCNESMIQAHWFFFCVTGINMTKKVLFYLKTGKYDKQIFTAWSKEKETG